MATAQTTETRLHPIVTLDYRVRVIAMLVMGLIPLFHFNGRPPLPDEDRGLAKIEGLLQKRNPA